MTLSSQQYASLADHSYGRDQQGNPVDLASLVGKSTVIDGVSYRILAHVDARSGYQGTIYQREDTRDIVVAHRGTEFGREPFRDGLLADGGMVANRTNSQANDAIALTREAQRLAREEGLLDRRTPPEVTVTGHSLGGTLAQITAHHFDLRGETFNAYGAASLDRRIPEGGNRVTNHVMAADAVSAASPHYGEVRVYAQPGEISQLRASGYNNVPLVGGLVPNSALVASVNGSHMMHNFLNVNGDGRPDASALGDRAARTRADDNVLMIDRYRDDVRDLRRAVTVGLRGPGGLIDDAIDGIRGPLPAGEPARREEEQRRRRGASLDDGASLEGAAPDMRNPEHAANGRYRQAFAGVTDIDRSMGRTPDGSSERLAASLTAASVGLSDIGQVALSRDGSRAFAMESPNGPTESRARVDVEVARAVQRPVEASTQDWQTAALQLAQEQAKQPALDRDRIQSGPALA